VTIVECVNLRDRLDLSNELVETLFLYLSNLEIFHKSNEKSYPLNLELGDTLYKRVVKAGYDFRQKSY